MGIAVLPFLQGGPKRATDPAAIKKPAGEPEAPCVEEFGSYRKGYAQFLWITRSGFVRLLAKH